MGTTARAKRNAKYLLRRYGQIGLRHMHVIRAWLTGDWDEVHQFTGEPERVRQIVAALDEGDWPPVNRYVPRPKR